MALPATMAADRSDPRLLVLRVLAVLIALRSLTNIGKPFGTGSGLVFLGYLLTGPLMWVLAPLLGVYMLVWAYGLWTLAAYARPMGLAYVALVTINVIGFPLHQSLPPGATLPMYAVYALVAVGVPALAVVLHGRLRAAA
jgi:hypothetical protein